MELEKYKTSLVRSYANYCTTRLNFRWGTTVRLTKNKGEQTTDYRRWSFMRSHSCLKQWRMNKAMTTSVGECFPPNSRFRKILNFVQFCAAIKTFTYASANILTVNFITAHARHRNAFFLYNEPENVEINIKEKNLIWSYSKATMQISVNQLTGGRKVSERVTSIILISVKCWMTSCLDTDYENRLKVNTFRRRLNLKFIRSRTFFNKNPPYRFKNVWSFQLHLFTKDS